MSEKLFSKYKVIDVDTHITEPEHGAHWHVPYTRARHT